MSREERIRRQQMICQAEGYLELGMPEHALQRLAQWDDPDSLDGHALYLRGEALRSLERCGEALIWLERAADLVPDDIHILLALGWCHKRTDRIDLAIEDLDRALEIDSSEAIIHYNLACYWSLARHRQHALQYLARAIEIDSNCRDLVHEEPDFDFVRDDPDFQTLVAMVV
jgi:tetratricopeptide (TPR) repeat protein